jgi:hypothetical protein
MRVAEAARRAVAKVTGLFVEDRLFAIELALCLAFFAIVSRFPIGRYAFASTAFFLTIAAILVSSVARASRRR